MTMNDDDVVLPTDELPLVIVCAGPPACLLEGDEAVESAQAGCPMCKRLEVQPDGSTRELKVQTN